MALVKCLIIECAMCAYPRGACTRLDSIAVVFVRQEKSLALAYLRRADVVAAAAVCREWHAATFHPSLAHMWMVFQVSTVVPRRLGTLAARRGGAVVPTEAISSNALVAFLRRADTQLTAFDAAGCLAVTDDVIQALCDVPRPRLKCLQLANCPNVSSRALLALVSQLPSRFPALLGVCACASRLAAVHPQQEV